MSIEYKSGFIEELNRKSEAIEEFIKIIEKNKSKLEESLKNTKYADTTEDEMDKIIAKLNNMLEKGEAIEEAKAKIKNL